jgi:hypothetical protein
MPLPLVLALPLAPLMEWVPPIQRPFPSPALEKAMA